MSGGQVADERVDLRMLPVAVAAWGMAFLVTGHLWWAAVGVLVVLAGVVRCVRRWRLLAAGALVVALCCGAVGVGRVALLTRGPLAEAATDRAFATVEIDVTADPHSRAGAGSFGPRTVVAGTVRRLETDGAWRLRAPVRVFFSGDAASTAQRLRVGERVEVDGLLAPATPGEPTAAIVRARGAPRVVRPAPAPLRWVERVRAGLRSAVAERRLEQRALVPALVLGDTQRVERPLEDDFRSAGLLHLLAVSGANLTLLLGFVQVSARWLGLRGRALRAVGPCCVVVFVLVCRTEPSVVRAAAMGVVSWAALAGGVRARAGPRNLAVAVTALLLIDPFLSRSLGFVLSVSATGGIIGLARWWADRLHWLPRWVADAVAVPVAAQITTQPVATAISGQVSLVGVIANALAGPFVGPATVLGFATAGVSLVSPGAAAVTGWFAAWCAQAIITIAHVTAALPGATLAWPATPLAIGLLTALCVAGAAATPWVLRRPMACAGVALALVVTLLRGAAQPGWPARGWLITACDVGQGDGVVLRAGPRAAVVVDTGPDPGALRRCLSALRISSVPMLVLTHFHADHVGGLDALAGLEVGLILLDPYASPLPTAEAVQALARARGIPVRLARAGERFRIGEIGWHTLQAGRECSSGEGDDSAVENDSSVVARASVGSLTVLLTGDIGPDAQRCLVASAGASDALVSDVLKVAHHGSSRQDAGFLAATRARVALYSCGRGNGYGHPSPRAIRATERLGMVTVRTDHQGSISLAEDVRGLRIVGQREGP